MTAPLDAGRLRHRVVLQARAGTADLAGGETADWETVATVWAEVEPVRAAEAVAGEHAMTRITHRVTMRWRGDVTGGMRMLHRGRKLAVVAAADPDETRRLLVATATEEAA